MRYGLIGTRDGIARFKEWVSAVQKPIIGSGRAGWPFFPGFEAVFRVPISSEPYIERIIDQSALSRAVHLEDAYQRVYEAVDLYYTKITAARIEEEDLVDLWFVIVPDMVYDLCRPKSRVPPARRVQPDRKVTPELVRRLHQQRPLFDAEEEYETAKAYEYEVDFRNQLKARLLEHKIVTQVIRESTLLGNYNRMNVDSANDMRSSIAWNLTTATFYKAGGRPWKLASVREGVCYVGLVFKIQRQPGYSQNACCAAQMFLDSGDGLVFKSAVGPWYNENTGQFHLKRKDAKELITRVLRAYEEYRGEPPKEIFIHGKVRFDDEEWAGFQEATTGKTKIVGVRIRDFWDLKVFRDSSYPLLRGMAYIRDDRTAYLWTRGFIPRLQTYPGREVPNPLLIDVCKGDADIRVVLQDIMGLTKLNYNACIYGDGLPVTLRFADRVGEILTAAPISGDSPLPFRHYI
ncbi:MAG: hypothetical protein IMF26_04420 [Candidatus Fermentithermobacillus carboniphilus]|uniref:Piwi domain-containing protein n=1 Tax=Candidatus Fermentithermobacillus carboniphilus TaxID=3085328 RepID=A0AAT9LEW1_9FIRM|nr:MAG: hypothetical protein IMF26_04420 [Candidatus Fermentithermobacillus carboniphilus]